MNLPKVSIVTVTFNAAPLLPKTIESVLSQDYENLEYIIIDGGSTDDSISIIKKFEDKIDYWHSKPDKGIYDAMNKSLNHVKGDYVNFMNAGDYFKSPSTIKKVFSLLKDSPDLIYGDHEVIYDSFIKIKKAKSPDLLWKGMVFSHQSLFVKTQILKEKLFDLNTPIIADFKFIFECWVEGRSFHNSQKMIACYSAGGLSEVKNLKTKRLTWKVVRSKLKSCKVDFYYIRLICVTTLVEFTKWVLPARLFESMMKAKNRIK